MESWGTQARASSALDAIRLTSLSNSHLSVKNFTPMNANFGLIAPLGYKIRGKKEKYLAYAQRSLEEITSICPQLADFLTNQ